MDISAGSKKSGANLQIYQSNGTAAQKFIFKKSSMELPENDIIQLIHYLAVTW